MDENLFNPQSIAVIGGSPKKGSIGNILINNLLSFKYRGKIFPVNPKYERVGKLRCYSTVLDIEESVDLAIIAIPAALAVKVVEECAWRNKPIKNIIIISAGFSESGKGGDDLERRLKQLAREHNLNIVGPNCLGLINATKKINISFSKNNFSSGNIGLIMQSGAFTTALFDMAKGEGLGFSLVATLGNKTVLDETDFIGIIAADTRTKVIGIYVEDFKRGRRFMEKLSSITMKKPVVILKAGNSKRSAKAIMSHTGAMAGETDVAKEAIEKCGGIFVSNLLEFVGALKFFSGFGKIKSNEVAVVTNAGGPGVIATDLIEDSKSVRMKKFSKAEEDAIKSVIPKAGSAANPIDILGDADAQRYEAIFNVIANFGIGAALAIVTPQAQTDVKNIAKAIKNRSQNFPFPILPVFLGSEAGRLANTEFFPSSEMAFASLSNFSYPIMAVNALEKACQAIKNQNKLKNIKTTDGTKNSKRMMKAKKILELAAKDGREILYYHEGRDLAGLYSIGAVESLDIKSRQDVGRALKIFASKKTNDSFVLKVDSPHLLHKNAKGGLVLGLKNKLQAFSAYENLRKVFKREKFILQPQIKPGFEVLVGIKKDPTFGHTILAGVGGIMAEIFDKKLLWILPVSRNEIQRKINDSFFGKIFEKQSMDLERMVDIVEKVAAIAAENPQIQQMDLNPVMFYKDNKPVCVDIKIISKSA